MASDLLARARAYESEYGSRIPAEERPVYHITPTVGWLNDPNGFSWYGGKYHLFYQYNPYSTQWDTMHWGHLVSEDLVKWERLPAAFAPDAPYDACGVFSGSAMTAPDGRHLIMYTGVGKKDGAEAGAEAVQTQCLAFGDGRDYVKYEKNPVITADMLPPGSSEIHFRDPKIWYEEEEGVCYAVLGSSTEADGGTVVLFQSRDLTTWEYVTTLEKSRNDYGFMWECPDFFRLGDTDFLLVLPMKMQASGEEFHAGNNAAYMVGHYDKKKHAYTRRGIFALDYGIDFYATQSMVTPDGRRVMIVWMQTPEVNAGRPSGTKWFGQMTVVRELSERDGRLIQNPVRELENYRRDPVFYQDRFVDGRVSLPDVSGRSVDLTVRVRPAGGDSYQKFTLRVAEKGGLYTSVTYDPAESVLYFDRSRSGLRDYVISQTKAHVRYRDEEITLRVLIDRFSVEVFVNDGEQTLTSTIYTPQEADGISFEAVGAAVIDVEKYTIEV